MLLYNILLEKQFVNLTIKILARARGFSPTQTLQIILYGGEGGFPLLRRQRPRDSHRPSEHAWVHPPNLTDNTLWRRGWIRPRPLRSHWFSRPARSLGHLSVNRFPFEIHTRV